MAKAIVMERSFDAHIPNAKSIEVYACINANEDMTSRLINTVTPIDNLFRDELYINAWYNNFKRDDIIIGLGVTKMCKPLVIEQFKEHLQALVERLSDCYTDAPFVYQTREEQYWLKGDDSGEPFDYIATITINANPLLTDSVICRMWDKIDNPLNTAEVMFVKKIGNTDRELEFLKPSIPTDEDGNVIHGYWQTVCCSGKNLAAPKARETVQDKFTYAQFSKLSQATNEYDRIAILSKLYPNHKITDVHSYSMNGFPYYCFTAFEKGV